MFSLGITAFSGMVETASGTLYSGFGVIVSAEFEEEAAMSGDTGAISSAISALTSEGFSKYVLVLFSAELSTAADGALS